MKKKQIIVGMLLASIYSVAYSAEKSVADYGAIPDAGNDDTAAITAALNSGHSIYFPPGEYIITGNIAASRIAAIDSVFSSEDPENPATIKSLSGNTLALYYFSGIENFIFDNVGLRVHGGSDRENNRTIKNNVFNNLNNSSSCLILDPYFDTPKNVDIENNTFSDCHYAVSGRAKDSGILSNVSGNGVTRHLWFTGAERLIIEDNKFTGGIVGIGFFCKSNGSEFLNNIISNNKLSNMSEEGISIDMIGNQSTSYSRWTDSVYGWELDSNNIVTKIYINGEPALQSLLKTTIVFFDANQNIKGKTAIISGMGIDNVSGKYYLNLSKGPDANDIYPDAGFVVLSYLVLNNEIKDNTIENIGRTGIGLHGAGMNTLIEYNEIKTCNTEENDVIQKEKWGGIVIRNINNAGATPGLHGPTFNNKVENNSFKGRGCDLKAMTLNYGGIAVFNAIGNTARKNEFEKQAKKIWLDQE